MIDLTAADGLLYKETAKRDASLQKRYNEVAKLHTNAQRDQDRGAINSLHKEMVDLERQRNENIVSYLTKSSMQDGELADAINDAQKMLLTDTSFDAPDQNRADIALLLADIEKLNRKIGTHKAEIKGLLEQRIEDQKRITDLESSISTLTATLREEMEKEEELNRDIAAMRGTQTELEWSLEGRKAANEELNGQLQSTLRSLKIAQSKFTAADKNLELCLQRLVELANPEEPSTMFVDLLETIRRTTTDTEFQRANVGLTDFITREYNTLSEKIDTLRTRFETAVNRRKNIEEELEASKQAKSRLEDEVTKQQHRVNDMTNKLSEAAATSSAPGTAGPTRARFDEVTKNLKERQVDLEAQRRLVSEKEDEIAQLKRDLRDANHRIEALIASEANLKGRSALYQETLDFLGTHQTLPVSKRGNAVVSFIKRERELHNNRIENMEKEKEVLEEEKKRLENEKRTNERQIADDRLRHQNLEAQIEMFQKKQLKLEKELSELKKSISEKEISQGATKAKTSTFSRQIKDLQSKLEEADKRNTALLNANNVLANKARDLEDSSGRLNTEISTMRTENEGLRKANISLDDSNERLKANRTRIQEEDERLKTEIAKLRTDNEGLRKTNKTLTDKNQELKARETRAQEEERLGLRKPDSSTLEELASLRRQVEASRPQIRSDFQGSLDATEATPPPTLLPSEPQDNPFDLPDDPSSGASSSSGSGFGSSSSFSSGFGTGGAGSGSGFSSGTGAGGRRNDSNGDGSDSRTGGRRDGSGSGSGIRTGRTRERKETQAPNRSETIDMTRFTSNIPEQQKAWSDKLTGITDDIDVGDPEKVYRAVEDLLRSYYPSYALFFSRFYVFVGLLEGACAKSKGTFWISKDSDLEHMAKQIVEAATTEIVTMPVSEAEFFPLSKAELARSVVKRLREKVNPNLAPDPRLGPATVLTGPKDFDEDKYRTDTERRYADDYQRLLEESNAKLNALSPWSEDYKKEEAKRDFLMRTQTRYLKRTPGAPLLDAHQLYAESAGGPKNDVLIFDREETLKIPYNFWQFLQDEVIIPLNKDQKRYVVELKSQLGHSWTNIPAGHSINDIAYNLTDHLWENMQIRAIGGSVKRIPSMFSVNVFLSKINRDRVTNQVERTALQEGELPNEKILAMLQAAVNPSAFFAFARALSQVGVLFDPGSERFLSLMNEGSFIELVAANYVQAATSLRPGVTGIVLRTSAYKVSALIDAVKKSIGRSTTQPVVKRPIVNTKKRGATGISGVLEAEYQDDLRAVVQRVSGSADVYSFLNV